MKVLVTGAGALLGQGIIKSLLAMKARPYVIAVDPSRLSAGLFWADERHLIPLANSPSFLDAFSDLLAKTKPDAVLIGTDVELAILAEARPNLENAFNTRIVVSEPAVIAIADDKFLTYEFLKTNGLPHPRSCLPDDLNGFLQKCRFPLIVKPRQGARSVGVFKVNNRRELEHALSFSLQPVIQEYLDDTLGEYTAGVVCFEGEVKGSIVMKRDLKDGNTYRAYSGHFPELNRQIRTMAQKLNPHGPCNFQFRLGENGEAKVFEINARFSGTTPLRALVGFNEVEFVLDYIVNGKKEFSPTIERKTILRYWSEIALENQTLEEIV